MTGARVQCSCGQYTSPYPYSTTQKALKGWYNDHFLKEMAKQNTKEST